MACGDRAGQARRSRAARGRRSCASPQLEYRRWESNPHGRFRPEDFKSSASAIPPRRLLRRSIDRQEMPQKERAGPARPVHDRRWSDSQSIGPERWNSNPRPSTDLTTVTEAFLSCDQSTWQVKGLQQIHLGSSGQAIADRSVVSMMQRSTSHNKPVGSVDLGFSLWSWRRRGWDSNPRTGGTCQRFSRPSRSTTLAPLRKLRQKTDDKWQIAKDRWQIAKGLAGSGRAAGARVVHWPTSSMMSSAT